MTKRAAKLDVSRITQRGGRFQEPLGGAVKWCFGRVSRVHERPRGDTKAEMRKQYERRCNDTDNRALLIVYTITFGMTRHCGGLQA